MHGPMNVKSSSSSSSLSSSPLTIVITAVISLCPENVRDIRSVCHSMHRDHYITKGFSKTCAVRRNINVISEQIRHVLKVIAIDTVD